MMVKGINKTYSKNCIQAPLQSISSCSLYWFNSLYFSTINGVWKRLTVFVLQYTKHIPEHVLSHNVASGSEITSCIKIDKLLAVYRLSNIM